MEKRKLIMEKALELFAKQGFGATSVQAITEHSGISKGAFYLSFKSKDELILALIHDFLQEFIADIDRIVTESEREQLIYNFYYYHFERLSEQGGAAKIFMKEQTHFLNDEFFAQIIGYNEMLQLSILKMLEKVYGEKVTAIKYDLVYTIQGLMKSYMELLLFTDIPFDNQKLTQSLVEKTNLLVEHMTLPVITFDAYKVLREPLENVLTLEKVFTVVDETLTLLDDSVEKESLQLLKNELTAPSMPEAVILGLLNNLKSAPNCKRAYYFLHMYWERNK